MSEIDSAHYDSIDPDDAPELTDVFFARADEFKGTQLIKRAEHRLANADECSIGGLAKKPLA